MSPPDPFPTSALLAESAWLKRLALRLVSEDSGAEDAAQETLAKALVHPPSSAVPLRRWLAAVLRNVVRQERRTSARREARELARPLAQDEEPADALAERLELHEKLVAAVRGLSEPYRTTVALRFLEDLTPPRVAARMGVPLKTVHTRLERALVQLRERLDRECGGREHGGRETWLRVFLPLVPVRPPLALAGPASATPLLAPLLAMSTLWKWTGACAAIAALGFLGVRALDDAPPRAALATAPAAPASAVELASPPRAELATPAPVAREAIAPALADARATSAAPTAPAPTPELLVGFVRDLEQRPVAGLSVAYERIEDTDGSLDAAAAPLPGGALSDGDGRFELAPLEGSARLVARGRGYATVVAPTLLGPHPPEPPLVFVAPERSYAGRVVDEQGAPVAGAELSLVLERELARRLTPGTFVGILPSARTRSDAAGAFAFDSVGGAPGSALEAEAADFGRARLELPAASASDLVVTLARLAGAKQALAGRVLHADGSPAPGAYVSCGGESVRAREDGAFELELAGAKEPARVQAVLQGFLPVARALPLAPGEELVLVLGEAARTLAGRVLDGAGEPVPGARVWTLDGERFGTIPKRAGQVSFMLTYDLEGVIAGADDQRGGREAHADAQGAFALTGLLDRAYALYAVNPRTLELVGPVTVSAGSSGIVLTLPGEPAQRVAGRVTTLSGAPLAGAQLHVERERRGADGGVLTHRLGDEQPVETDADGRFAYEALCVEGTRLLVSTGSAPNATPFALAAQPDLEHLELAISAPCHLRVFLDDPSMANSLGLLDERDQSLFFTFQLGGVLCSSAGVQIDGGVSDLLLTDERARTLVLTKDGAEVARVPLHLVPGQVNEIRP